LEARRPALTGQRRAAEVFLITYSVSRSAPAARRYWRDHDPDRARTRSIGYRPLSWKQCLRSRQACANMVGPSSATCSLRRMPAIEEHHDKQHEPAQHCIGINAKQGGQIERRPEINLRELSLTVYGRAFDLQRHQRFAGLDALGRRIGDRKIKGNYPGVSGQDLQTGCSWPARSAATPE
jgi:hypothetical protein